jgi:hypothetical protein
VRASTNAGAGNCLDFETDYCPTHGIVEHLCLDFYGGGAPGNMNAYEGCLEAAGNYYAVVPKVKAANDYAMLQALGALGATQHYCYRDEESGLWIPCEQPNRTPPIP